MTWPLVVVRLALAAVFGVAAVAKLRSREGTQWMLAEFGVAPRFVGAGAWALPAACEPCIAAGGRCGLPIVGSTPCACANPALDCCKRYNWCG